MDSSVLKEWYLSEYSACDHGTLFGELRGELKNFFPGYLMARVQRLSLGVETVVISLPWRVKVIP